MGFDLTPFGNLIKERTGLSFGDSRSTRLKNVLQAVMAEKQVHSPSQYYSLILKDEEEFIDLVNRLTVNETYFFREPAHLRLLTVRILPDVLKGLGKGTPVRIMSAGCSTGEEPYSLVMAVMERMGIGISPALIKVVGVDIDSDAIYRARKGVYGRQSFRSLEEGIKNRFFDRTGRERYRIKDFVKGFVDFRVFNLLSEEYPRDLLEMDVIFYRNVSIYFDSETQRRIFRKLSDSLKSGGCLITSATETLSHNLNLLDLVELDGVFFYRKMPEPGHKGSAGLPGITSPRSQRTYGNRVAPPEALTIFETAHKHFRQSSPLPQEKRTLPPVENPLAGREADPERPLIAVASQGGSVPAASGGIQEHEPRPRDLFSRALAQAEKKQYDLSLDSLESLLSMDAQNVGAYTLKANVLVNMDRLDDAAGACLRSLQIEPLCLEAYLLLGIIAKRREDHEESLKRFREALYVKPNCWLAHFCLAELYHAREEHPKARREYEILLTLSERGGLSETDLPLFRLSIPVEQVVLVCRHKLTLLGREGSPKTEGAHGN